MYYMYYNVPTTIYWYRSMYIVGLNRLTGLISLGTMCGGNMLMDRVIACRNMPARMRQHTLSSHWLITSP